MLLGLMALSIFVERLLDDYILSPITANSVILNDLGAHAFAVILLAGMCLQANDVGK